MEPVLFPCVQVKLGACKADAAIDAFLNSRPSQRWVLLGQHAVQSHMQLWTAWIQAARNELREAMVARSVDAEFLRYLAGTHHISEAFSRAGLQQGQSGAWVVYLPEAQAHLNELGHAHPVAGKSSVFDDELGALLAQLNWTRDKTTTTLSIEGRKQLGIDVDGWPEALAEESLLAHVLMADDQSSSHR